MDPGLVTSLSGALAQSKRVELIANNLANADTVGYKADDINFEETLLNAGRPDTRTDIPERPYKESELLSKAGNEHRAVLYGAEFTDLRAGPMRQTANPLDVAIEGNGFLEVLTPDGVRLTRAGSLALDPGGRLMTQDGFLVLGSASAKAVAGPAPASASATDDKGDRPDFTQEALRAITVGRGVVRIDAEGNIYSGNDRGNALVGRLSVVQVGNPQAMKKMGRGLFSAPAEALVQASRNPASAKTLAGAGTEPVMKVNPLGSTGIAPVVHQGMLEASNVNPVSEMTRLIEAHRMFDQNARMLQSIGEANARVSEVGKF